MTSEYRIALHTKTRAGFENYAEFYIGGDESQANELFRRLKGSPDNIDDGVLLIELRAICRGLPVDMRMLQCTLDEMTENCRIITKHVFNSFNREASLTE
jgi:hypothetical protein